MRTMHAIFVVSSGFLGVIATWGLASASPAADVEDRLRFLEHVKRFNVVLGNTAFDDSLDAFLANEKYIRTHNANPNTTSTLALNKWSHLSFEEWAERMGTNAAFMRGRIKRRPRDLSLVGGSGPIDALPSIVDWRAKGVVTPVKSQGDCGSCFAFSATGSIEGAWALAGHRLVNFSEQQILDCSRKFGNEGCGGGHMDDAFSYIIDAGGLSTEEGYPYSGIDERCKENWTKTTLPGFALAGFSDIEPDNETALLAAVAYRGPVSVAIHAMLPVFQHYRSGVISAPCAADETDHSVRVIFFCILLFSIFDAFFSLAGTHRWIWCGLLDRKE